MPFDQIEVILPESKHLFNSAVKNIIEDSFFILLVSHQYRRPSRLFVCVFFLFVFLLLLLSKTAFWTSGDVILELNGCWSSTLSLKLSSVSVSKFPSEFNNCSNLLFQ